MGKKAKITLICALAALPLLLIAAFLLFVLPYVNAASSMPEGASLAFFELAEGEYRVEWTEGVNATHYKLAIDGEEAAAGTLDTNSADVSGLAEGEHVFTVTPFGSWSLFGAEKLREGEPVSISVPLKSPDPPRAEWLPDEDAKNPQRRAGAPCGPLLRAEAREPRRHGARACVLRRRRAQRELRRRGRA